jgi:amino acid adenylation domain-containing protein
MDELDFGIRCPADFIPVPDAILETTIVPRFETIVRQQQDRTAIQSHSTVLTFRELDNAVNELAWRIIDSAGDDESPVAFLFDDELLSIVALLAILKAGRAYTSLHVANSNEQLRAFLEDSTARLLITGGSVGDTANRLTADSSRVSVLHYDAIERTAVRGTPGRVLTPEMLFSISYTSGSTGRPKGVVERHRRRAQNAQFRNNLCRISPSDRVVLLTSVSHRAAYPSLMAMVVSGATLCLLDLKTITARRALTWLQEQEITVYRSTPSIFRAIFGRAPDHLVLPGIRFMALGGEPVTSADVEGFKAHTAEDCVLINSFASTEAGTISLNPVYHHTPPFKGLLPAGRPPPQMEVFLVDAQRRIVGEGMEGEIAVRGEFLSDGYWQQPELTAEKFAMDAAHPGPRTFYTSDYGRWLPDGTLEVLGRKDRQVKIRGFRVQLEAVELAIRSQPGVEDAAVIESSSRAGQKRLVAYVCMRKGKRMATYHMRRELASRLPSYAVPSTIVQVDALPRTPTGKIASAQLPPPTAHRPDLEGGYVAPRTQMESEIATIWARILELDEVGIEDDFFALGGDSLSVLEMTLAVEKALATAVPAEFLGHPTIAALSALLTGEHPRLGDEDLFRESARERTPLRWSATEIHRREARAFG